MKSQKSFHRACLFSVHKAVNDIHEKTGASNVAADEQASNEWKKSMTTLDSKLLYTYEPAS